MQHVPAGDVVDEGSAPEGALPAAELLGSVNIATGEFTAAAELPELPGIPDDTEYSGGDMPYSHPDDEGGVDDDGAAWAWTTNPAALAQATLRARAVRQLDVGAALEAELRGIRRDMRHAQKLAALERELRRQRKQVVHLAAVLTLMANAAESEAAAVHCTDADDSEWLAKWADADPWGRQLVSHARFELGRARS